MCNTHHIRRQEFYNNPFTLQQYGYSCRLIGELFQEDNFSLDIFNTAQVFQKINFEKAEHPSKHLFDFYSQLVTIEW